ncbi:MAG: hypothetical protein ACHQ4H_14745 [Ktedonobacterales bacterium]
MDDGLGPFDGSDEPTEPMRPVRPGEQPHPHFVSGGGFRAPDDRGGPMPPLPPASPVWSPRGMSGQPEWPAARPIQRTPRLGAVARALEAARERQLSLGCGALAAIVLLGALVLAALTGSFAGFGNGGPFLPRPAIQAAPGNTSMPLPTPTYTATPTPSPTPSPTPLPTATPRPTATPAPLPTATPSPAVTPTLPPSPTPRPSPTPTALPGPGPTAPPGPTVAPAASPAASPGGSSAPADLPIAGGRSSGTCGCAAA